MNQRIREIKFNYCTAKRVKLASLVGKREEKIETPPNKASGKYKTLKSLAMVVRVGWKNLILQQGRGAYDEKKSTTVA